MDDISHWIWPQLTFYSMQWRAVHNTTLVLNLRQEFQLTGDMLGVVSPLLNSPSLLTV